MPRYVLAQRSSSEQAAELLRGLSDRSAAVSKRKKKPARVARLIRYEPNPDTRRDRLLKRVLGIVRKVSALGRIAGADMRYELALSCRDPRLPDKGYNCFASSSDASPVETLAEWTRRLEIDAARPESERQFSLFGPDRDPNGIPPTLNSFFLKALLPDSEGRGYRDGDREDEEIWNAIQAERALETFLPIESFPEPFAFAPRPKRMKRPEPLRFVYHDPHASESSSESSTPSVSVEFDDRSPAAELDGPGELCGPPPPDPPPTPREFLLGVADFLRRSRLRTADAARAFQ